MYKSAASVQKHWRTKKTAYHGLSQRRLHYIFNNNFHLGIQLYNKITLYHTNIPKNDSKTANAHYASRDLDGSDSQPSAGAAYARSQH